MTCAANLVPAAVAVTGPWEQDAGMPSIAVNGVQLYCEAHGSGPPLVLLGGLGLDVSEMGMLTGPLAAWFQVIAAGNRGTGRSAKPAAPIRPGRWPLTSPG